jgi:hypothetical protein
MADKTVDRQGRRPDPTDSRKLILDFHMQIGKLGGSKALFLLPFD